jgi:hypothetical protein
MTDEEIKRQIDAVVAKAESDWGHLPWEDAAKTEKVVRELLDSFLQWAVKEGRVAIPPKTGGPEKLVLKIVRTGDWLANDKFQGLGWNVEVTSPKNMKSNQVTPNDDLNECLDEIIREWKKRNEC